MAIPEFILRRMLVPDSVRFERSHFSFQIKNTYAPATITGLHVLVNGDEIPLDQVEYHVAGQSPAVASEISIRNPAPIPTGIQIEISGKLVSRPKRLILVAETKEAGTIRFTVFDNTDHRQLSPGSMTILHKPNHASLKIYPHKSFALSDQLTDVLDDPGFFQKFGALELPGLTLFSCPSVGFDFSLSTHKSVSPFVFPHIGTGDVHDVGEGSLFDELVNLCRQSRTQCYLTVDSDLLSAATLFKWLTAESRNHRGTRSWIIAGSAWQPWDISPANARIYAAKVSRFAQVLHSIDSTARVGMFCKFAGSKQTDDSNQQWNEAAFSEAGENIDFVFWQLPPFESDLDSQEVQNQGILNSYADYIGEIDQSIARIRDQLTTRNPARKISQAIDLSTFDLSLMSQHQINPLCLNKIELEIIRLKLLTTIVAHSDDLVFTTMFEADKSQDQNGFFNNLLAKSKGQKNYRIILPTVVSSSQSGGSSSSEGSRDLSAFLYSSTNSNRLNVTMANLSTEKRLLVNLTYPRSKPHSGKQSPSFIRSFIDLLLRGSRAEKTLKVILKPHAIKRFQIEWDKAGATD